MNILNWLPFGKVPEISVKQLNKIMDHVQILDVRTALEFRQSHIKGAINVPITQFNSVHIAKLDLDPTRPVVTICLSAHRSIPATRQLKKMSFNASQLQGGMREWWRRDQPCVKED